MKKLLLLLSALALTGCNTNQIKNKPLEWCFDEIRHYKDYEDAAFTYQIVVPDDYKAESKHNLECFVIQAYGEEKISEWFCFVEYEDSWHYTDCDMIWEYRIEEDNDYDYYLERDIKSWISMQEFDTDPYEILNYSLTKCEFTPYGYDYYALDVYYTTGEVKVKHYFLAYNGDRIIQITEVKE